MATAEGYDDDDTSRQVLRAAAAAWWVADGYVLTNYHVVEDATMLEVTSGDKVYPAELKGVPTRPGTSPCCMLRTWTLSLLCWVTAIRLSVGDWAICIGNPLQLYRHHDRGRDLCAQP